MINYDDFKKVELRVAKILSVERVEGSDKLLKLQVDLGEKDETGMPVGRQIIAGIGKVYDPATLVGREIAVVANLEARTFTLRRGSGQVGLESQGMLLASDSPNGPVFLMPEKEVAPGSIIK